MTEHKTQTQTGELTITRTFDAPRDLVWKVWTEPEHAAKWWCPNGFTNPVFEADVRPGGAMRIHMRGPDGTVFPNNGVYEEVDKPHRLVFSGSVEFDGARMFDVRTTVAFEELDRKTTVTIQQTYTNLAAGAADMTEGANEGWNQCLDKLRDLLAVTTRG